MPPTDRDKHAFHMSVAPPENQARSVLAARKAPALKVRSVSTGRVVSKERESNPTPRLTRSISSTRPTISTPQTTAFSTVRSSSVPKKTSSALASASSHKTPHLLPLTSALSVTRSSTVRTLSRSSTPSRIHSKSHIPSVGKTRSAPNSRSSTPISRPPNAANLASTLNSQSLTRSAESITSGSSSGRVISSGRRSISGSRVSSTGRSFPSRNSPPQIPPRLEATTSMPRLSTTIPTKGSIAASNVTRGRGNGHASDGKDSKNSLQMAIKHMDIQNGKTGRRPFSGTTLYPHSMRSSSVSKSKSGSQQAAMKREKSNGQGGDDDEDDGRSLAKAGNAKIYDSARYDAFWLGKDVKDTNWLLSMDDPSSDSDQSLLFDNGFEPPPEPFPPL